MTRKLGGRDAVLALLVFAAIVAYLVYLPRTLSRADESHFLYEAKRIRDGEVMYRDFFQFVTPGASYIMALLFRVFGTSIQTARVATAALHGLMGVVIFACCRTLGVRWLLAMVPPVAFLALGQSAWQFASWHWFSAFFTVLVLLAMLRTPWAARPRTAIVPGIAVGLVAAVQQQKGVAVALGVLLIFLLDHAIDRRYPRPGSWRDLAARVACFGAGVALVMVPLLLAFIAAAGFDPVYQALVRFPLVNYRKSFTSSWGKVLWVTAGSAKLTCPVILAYLPLALVPAALRLVAGVARAADRAAVRQLTVLLVSAGAATLSIWYFPDFIHIAFIAPVFLVAAGEALDWLLGAAETALRRGAPAAAPRVRAGVEAVLAAALVGALALHLRDNAVTLEADFPYPHDTPFGRIDFSGHWQAILIDHTRALFTEAGSNVLFAYPNTSEPYLITGARNPTPYQYFYAPVSPREHTQRVLQILRTGSVPFVMVQGFFLHPRDPVAREILDHYEVVDIPALDGLGEAPTLTLYRRKGLTAASPAASGE
jgi:hypothetical protein